MSTAAPGVDTREMVAVHSASGGSSGWLRRSSARWHRATSSGPGWWPTTWS
jgi:hypothetical protein